MSGAVNANIPLSFRPAPVGPNFGAAIADASTLMQLQQAGQEEHRQNQLRGILSSPGALDDMGQPKPETMTRVMGVDPNAGMKLQSNFLATQQKRLQMDALKSKTSYEQADMLNNAYSPILVQYKENAAKMSPAQALKIAQDATTETTERLRTGGGMTPEAAQRLPTQFDPMKFEQMALQTDMYLKTRQQDRLDKRADDRQKEQFKHDEQAATATGVDVDGRAIVLHPNATDPKRQAIYLGTNDPVPPDKLTGAHKMGTTGSDRPNVAAERDAMTVADARIAKAEQDRGSSLSLEEKAEMRRTARSDPKVQEAIRKQESTAISDDAARLTAEETLRGDWHGTVGMGRNAASMRKIADERAKIAKEQGMTGADLAANTAEFNGIMSAERVLGTRGAGIDLGIAEAQKFAPMVLELSDKIDRTRFPSINAMQLAIQRGTGGENVIRLTDALNAYKMAYTQILTRGGMPTDDSRRRSDEVINQAWSNGQIHAAIDQLNKEMTAARSAVPEVRDNLYFALTGKKRTSEVLPTTLPATSGGPAVGAKATEQQMRTLPRPKNPADAAKFEPGTFFILPDGTVGQVRPTQGGAPAETKPPAATKPAEAKPEAAKPAESKAAPKYIEDKVYIDAQGNRAVYKNGKFVDVP